MEATTIPVTATPNLAREGSDVEAQEVEILNLEQLIVATESLHSTLRKMDPARWRSTEAREIQLSVEGAQAVLSRRSDLPPELAGAAMGMANAIANVPMPMGTELSEWVGFREALSTPYETLVATLAAEGVRLPSLRPTNYRRSLGHAFCGLLVLALIEAMPPKMLIIPAAMAFITVWLTEATRKISPAWNERVMRLFSPIAHPYEVNTINSGTWYVTALFVLSLFQNQAAAAIAVVVLALADPAAALVGRRFGTIGLVNNRSLQGTSAFFAVGAIASLLVVWIFHAGEMSGSKALCVCLLAAFLGAIAELFSSRVDDNLSIPVVVGTAAFLLLML